jgi:hypothetical protein
MYTKQCTAKLRDNPTLYATSHSTPPPLPHLPQSETYKNPKLHTMQHCALLLPQPYSYGIQSYGDPLPTASIRPSTPNHTAPSPNIPHACTNPTQHTHPTHPTQTHPLTPLYTQIHTHTHTFARRFMVRNDTVISSSNRGSSMRDCASAYCSAARLHECKTVGCY